MGRVLLDETRPLVIQADRAFDRVRRAAVGERQVLTVGYLPSVGNYVVPPLVRAFATTHPNIALSTEDLPIAALVDGLRSGRLDAGLTRPPLVNDLATEVVLSEPANEYPADDMRSWDERWQPGNYERNVEAVDSLRELADEKSIEVTQLALAWLLAQGDDIVPIPGTRRPERLEQNVAAADVELTDAELARIDEILPEGSYGSRYPEAMMPNW